MGHSRKFNRCYSMLMYVYIHIMFKQHLVYYRHLHTYSSTTSNSCVKRGTSFWGPVFPRQTSLWWMEQSTLQHTQKMVWIICTQNFHNFHDLWPFLGLQVPLGRSPPGNVWGRDFENKVWPAPQRDRCRISHLAGLAWDWLIHKLIRLIWRFPSMGGYPNSWFISWKSIYKWMIWGTPIFELLYMETHSVLTSKKNMHGHGI